MANTFIAQEVIQNKMENLLDTALDLNTYMTVDNSLTENAGMTKSVDVYTATGDVEEVAEGEGNTADIELAYSSVDYTVGTTQGRFTYSSEQEMKNPAIVDMGVKAMADKMTNDLTAKAITEFEKGTQVVNYATAPSFDDFVDAIAKFNSEGEDGLFALVNPTMKATLKKALKDDLKYSEDFVRTGYIGSVAGVPVIVSKAVSDDEIIVATKSAVTCYNKKGVEVESERIANTRTNKLYTRKVALVALTDNTKVVLIKKTV